MWIDKYDKDIETGVEIIVHVTIKCDYCGKKEEWYDVTEKDLTSNKTIEKSKKLNGWADIDVYTFKNKENIIEIGNSENQFHACPECRRTVLRITNEPLPETQTVCEIVEGGNKL